MNYDSREKGTGRRVSRKNIQWVTSACRVPRVRKRSPVTPPSKISRSLTKTLIVAEVALITVLASVCQWEKKGMKLYQFFRAYAGRRRSSAWGCVLAFLVRRTSKLFAI